MKPIIGSFRYRAEIDGLRALAVLAVVLYHAGFGFRGGFVGVDVFFVISGYLITSLIWKDLETGRFTLAGFWERRARRIAPALVVLLVPVLVAGWFLLLPSDYRELGKATAAQAVVSANVYYWRHTGYFDGVAEEMPLLHTWSLAVEEQFYLVVPILFWLAYRVRRLRTRSAMLSVLGIGMGASFALSIVGVARHPAASFYLLPTRAWELMLGSIVAFLPTSSALLERRGVRDLASALGLALVVVPGWVYSKGTPFPGLAAMAPCGGTALLIWANGRSGDRIPTLVGCLLALRPLVFVGLISYSLYLWHWPLLAYGQYHSFDPMTVGQRGFLVALGFILAYLSYRFVETPFRERRVARGRVIFGYAGGGLAVAMAGGLACAHFQGFPERVPARAQAYADAKDDLGHVIELTADDVRSDLLLPIGVRDGSAPLALLLWGDSHAMAAIPAFDEYLKDNGMSGRVAAHSSTAPVLDWFRVKKWGLNQDAVAFSNAVLDYVQQKQIRHVVMAARWRGYLDGPDDYDGFENAIVTTIRRLRATGAQPWVLVDVPEHPYSVPKVLSRGTLVGVDLVDFSGRPNPSDPYDGIRPSTLKAIVAAGGRVLNPRPLFMARSGDRYLMEKDGVALFRDQHHLTPAGARMMLLPLIRTQMGATAKSPLSSASGTTREAVVADLGGRDDSSRPPGSSGGLRGGAPQSDGRVSSRGAAVPY